METLIGKLIEYFPVSLAAPLAVIIVLVLLWQRVKGFFGDIWGWFLYLLGIRRCALINRVLKRWHTNSRPRLDMFFADVLLLQLRLHKEPFRCESDRERGFRTFRHNNKVIIELYHKAFSADSVVEGLREALPKAHRWNKLAESLGFKNSEMELIFKNVLSKDIVGELQPAYRVAEAQLRDTELKACKLENAFQRVISWYNEKFKGSEELSLDDALFRFIYLSEVKRLVGGSSCGL